MFYTANNILIPPGSQALDFFYMVLYGVLPEYRMVYLYQRYLQIVKWRNRYAMLLHDGAHVWSFAASMQLFWLFMVH